MKMKGYYRWWYWAILHAVHFPILRVAFVVVLNLFCFPLECFIRFFRDVAPPAWDNACDAITDARWGDWS